jgi:3-dehydroquinate synthase
MLAAVLEHERFSQIGILADANTQKHCYPLIQELLPPHSLYVIEPGEQHKTIQTVSGIWQWMTTQAWDRHALLINLGGGVIGDMGGFAAAAYKRGIRFLNIPTTLLAMVDASVGGKLGIDFMGFKNHIGFFTEPEYVLIDALLLQTLPLRELRSGYAEVIKHGLIADAAYLELLMASEFPALDFEAIIRRSVEIKKNVVESDPKEKGLRKILNFGHTTGHAIETHFLESATPLLHGEAIAMGMMIETDLSVLLCGLNQELADQLKHWIASIFELPKLAQDEIKSIAKLAAQDKKNRNGKLLFSLISRAGEAIWDVEVAQETLQKALIPYT